ncbi:jg17217 [Pararge aegeria aegeria]|uniref:Jg17217 protein n=1 Tax=Pararge aegeria aegeria TaxID=348720 RepID=A0A8S4SFM8_9NEOP|nr:jg17217 [Pararge aegeria aegeria]
MDPRVFLFVAGVALASARYTATYVSGDLVHPVRHPDGGRWVWVPESDIAAHTIYSDYGAPEDIEVPPPKPRCMFGNCVVNIKQ